MGEAPMGLRLFTFWGWIDASPIHRDAPRARHIRRGVPPGRPWAGQGTGLSETWGGWAGSNARSRTQV